MSVTTIREEELRCMKGEEGLVLQGCGGDLDEWVTGINDMLTEEAVQGYQIGYREVCDLETENAQSVRRDMAFGLRSQSSGRVSGR